MLGDALPFHGGAYHEAGDIDQKQQRDVALAAHFDEMRALDRAFGEQHAVIGQDSDLEAFDAGEPHSMVSP